MGVACPAGRAARRKARALREDDAAAISDFGFPDRVSPRWMGHVFARLRFSSIYLGLFGAHASLTGGTRFYLCLEKISTRSVVHTATPVPKKSLSAVHTPQANASADASTGQSLSSRPRNRCRAS